MKRAIIPRVLAVLCAGLFLTVSLAAQSGGRVTGQVADRLGAVVTNAKVVLRNAGDGAEQTATTDGNGRYAFNGLGAGNYELRVESGNFATSRRSFSLAGGATAEENFTLEVGSISESVTVTATRNDRDIFEVDVRADKLGSETLRERNITSTGAAVSQAANVTPVGDGPFSPRPRLRGLDSTRILVLIDGERLNTARVATDRAGPEVGLVSFDQVQNVEVVNGSGSVLYGTDALAGTINILTAEPEPAHQGLRVGGEINGFYSANEDGRRGGAKFDFSGHRYAVRIYGTGERFANYRAGSPFNESSQPLLTAGIIRRQIFSRVFPDNFNAPFTRTTDEVLNSQAHGDTVGLTARLFPTKKQNFKIALSNRHARSVGFPDFSPPIFFQKLSLPFSNLQKGSLRYERLDLAGWFPKLTLRAYGQSQDRNLRNDLTAFASSPPRPTDPPCVGGPNPIFCDSIIRTDVLSDTRQTVKTFGFDGQANLVAAKRHVLTTGVSYFRDHSRDARRAATTVRIVGFAFRPPAPATFIPQNITLAFNSVSFPQRVPVSRFANLGAFFQDEYQATDKLRFIGGVRFDRFNVESLPTPGYNPVITGLAQTVPPVDLTTLPNVNGQDITRNAVTGSFGVIYRVIPRVSLTGRIGRSYRHPNLEELFFAGPATIGNIIPNVRVEPETGINLDFGVKVRTDKYAASVSYFTNRYRNFISTEVIGSSPAAGSGGSISQAINFARLRLSGFEADLEVPRTFGSVVVTPVAQAAYLRGTILSGANPLTGVSLAGRPADNITPLKAIGGVRLNDQPNRVWGEYSARIQTRVERVSPLLTTSVFAIAQDYFGLNGFTVHNLRGGYNWRGERTRVGVVLGLENVGDKFYREQFQFAPARGRTFTVGFQFKFF
jgi:outer membrane receptor protein involved in Fe transport